MENNWKIVATAGYAPARVITNNDLSRIMDTSDQWIRERTGIRQRHISAGENTADLAEQVAKHLLARAGWSPQTLDLIVVATMSPDAYTPSTAAIIQGRLGADSAVAFDVTAACSGFVYALSVADRFLASHRFQRAMVIGSEVLSKIVDWQDRSTAVLFGDGAGGVLLESAQTPHLLGQSLATFGSLSDCLAAGETQASTTFPGMLTQLRPFRMNGRAVYRFATHEVPKSITAALEDADLPIERVDHFILHQANIRIIQQVARRLGQPLDKFATNIAEYGNTSAASEPLLLNECVEQGMVHRGDVLALSGFGGGLTTGTMIIKY